MTFMSHSFLLILLILLLLLLFLLVLTVVFHWSTSKSKSLLITYIFLRILDGFRREVVYTIFVLSLPTTIGITVTFILHSFFFRSLVRSCNFLKVFNFLLFSLWKSFRWQVIFFLLSNTSSSHLACVGLCFCTSMSQRILFYAFHFPPKILARLFVNMVKFLSWTHLFPLFHPLRGFTLFFFSFCTRFNSSFCLWV